MNYMSAFHQPFIMLVDDDAHSARMLTRMLLAHGAPTVHLLDGATAADEELDSRLNDPHAQLPGLVIVDLKSSSTATRDYIASLVRRPRSSELLIVAMAPTLERSVKESLIAAGAAAVFERHATLDAYRRESAGIVSFWVRNQRLSAVGA
ncbi:MAG TPA: hypothetical protein PK286_07185 [Devosia sp.]|nr:hypothetical protein [Devosia sp.]